MLHIHLYKVRHTSALAERNDFFIMRFPDTRIKGQLHAMGQGWRSDKKFAMCRPIIDEVCQMFACSSFPSLALQQPIDYAAAGQCRKQNANILCTTHVPDLRFGLHPCTAKFFHSNHEGSSAKVLHNLGGGTIRRTNFRRSTDSTCRHWWPLVTIGVVIRPRVFCGANLVKNASVPNGVWNTCWHLVPVPE